ncbi:site-specific recombinase XerD [Thermus oshimai JL-2]|uniref:Site-specific recombinase XerD n=1 Tax=Thermus oshimai JL-2 TaxID=751945 RepID=K7QZ33_THEOS|nr:tyrosine-type recombinase/integrase [Thermus oshimai]AFV76070.1 site-specific recombinase XerD [Thermus oshimai JL-2]
MLRPLPNYEDPAKRRLEAVRAAHEGDLEGLIALLGYHLAHKSGKRTALSARTLELYALAVRDFFRYLWPEGAPGPRVPLLQVTPDHIDAWLADLLAHGGHTVPPEERRPLKPSTAASYLAGIRALYRALKWAGAVRENPTLEVRPPKDPTPRHERRPALPQTLYRRLLNLIQKGGKELQEAEYKRFRDLLILRLMGEVGLRISEVEGLNVEDFDPVEEELHIQRGKGGKARTVPLPPDLAEGLQAWLKVRTLHAAPGEKALFINLGGRKAHGRRLRAWTIRKELSEALRALEAPRRYYGPHSLRHLAGTRLYQATGDLYLVATLLGHADVSTSQIYAKMDRSRLKEAVRNLYGKKP